MADIAKKVIADNSLDTNITVFPMRSTDVLLPIPIQDKASIIVTEIFDTELIGEGVLGTMTHALQEMAHPNCIVIPAAATCFIQLIESKQLWASHCLHARAGFPTMNPNGEYPPCPGAPSMHEIQIDCMSAYISQLSSPIPILEFDFKNLSKISKSRKNSSLVQITKSGTIHACIFWWTLHLNEEISLSTAPGNLI